MHPDESYFEYFLHLQAFQVSTTSRHRSQKFLSFETLGTIGT